MKKVVMMKEILRLTRAKIPNIKGWDSKVMTPLKPHRRKENVSLVGFDTEFTADKLLSVQLSVYDNQGILKSACITDISSEYSIDNLLSDTLRFLDTIGVKPSKHIYYVAHFATADIGQLTGHLGLKFMPVNSALHATNKTGEGFTLHIVDLFAYYPHSLAKISALIGLPKLEVGENIEHMDEFLKSNPEQFKAYAVRDAEITLSAFVKLRNFVWETYSVELLRTVSAASLAGNIFRVNYLIESPSPCENEVSYPNYKLKSGWSKRIANELHYSGILDVRSYALLCYWGGRAECYVHGYFEGDYALYDVSSLYPSCAMLQPLPNKDTVWQPVTLENLYDLEGFVKVAFEFPATSLFPNLPVHGKLNDKLYFPLSGVSFCTIGEVREALRLGCKIRSIHGWGFNPCESNYNHAIKRFMADLIERKHEAQKGTLEYETYKLLMNSLIGKLAQRRPEEDLATLQYFVVNNVPLPKRKRGYDVAGSMWCPEWASLVLGKARALMSQFIVKGALMTVTDSVLLPTDVNIDCEALDELKSVGSDLVREPYEVKNALLVRSKLYALRNSKGEIVKEAHHGVQLNPNQCKDIFAQALELGKDPEGQGKRTHLVKLKEALTKAKRLGSSEIISRDFHFRWDSKRLLVNPNVNMFREYSLTKPIENVEAFEQENFNATKRERRSKTTSYNQDTIAAVLTKRKAGQSIQSISKELGRSRDTIYKMLKEQTKPLTN